MIHKILMLLILAVLSFCVTADRSSQAVNLNAEDAKKKMILEKYYEKSGASLRFNTFKFENLTVPPKTRLTGLVLCRRPVKSLHLEKFTTAANCIVQ